MAHEDQDLDESDGEESFEFPPNQRKINTQPYDLSVQTLLEQWNDKLLLIPEIQREYVWDNGRASRLIESLLLNIPVPPLYFSETSEARFEVIDGHQRVRSIVRYLNNEFSLSGLRVLPELMGTRFYQLPDREQRFLRTRSLRVVVIGHDSHPSMKFEVFERLNTGGISLNAQELRNSLYRGPFNNELKKLALHAGFRTCIGTRTPRSRMVDEELILRFFALRDLLSQYRPPLKRVLNEYMNANKSADDEWMRARHNVFSRTMDLLADVLGPQAFRLIDPEGNPLRDKNGKPLPRGVNRALFDAQSIVFSWIESGISTSKKDKVLRQISSVLTDDTMQDAVQRATGDRKRLLHRVRSIASALDSSGVNFDRDFISALDD